ncbi:hypothetical protein PENTCL1PPCAC_27644, partial [Pristionchus entomophagus]
SLHHCLLASMHWSLSRSSLSVYALLLPSHRSPYSPLSHSIRFSPYWEFFPSHPARTETSIVATCWRFPSNSRPTSLRTFA